jgi:hypothetical protein
MDGYDLTRNKPCNIYVTSFLEGKIKGFWTDKQKVAPTIPSST